MRKFIFIAVPIVSSLFFLFPTQKVVIPTDRFRSQIEIETTAPIQAAEPVIADPIKVNIPSISLEAAIVRAELDPDGRMSVPEDEQTVSWWQYGVKPGEVGNAVLAGHFIISASQKGVFYNLRHVQKGDSIITTDENGGIQQFKVSRINVYKEKDFPTEEVYGLSNSKQLILITCSGTYSSKLDDYSHRLVITAVQE